MDHQVNVPQGLDGCPIGPVGLAQALGRMIASAMIKARPEHPASGRVRFYRRVHADDNGPSRLKVALDLGIGTIADSDPHGTAWGVPVKNPHVGDLGPG